MVWVEREVVSRQIWGGLRGLGIRAVLAACAYFPNSEEPRCSWEVPTYLKTLACFLKDINL